MEERFVRANRQFLGEYLVDTTDVNSTNISTHPSFGTSTTMNGNKVSDLLPVREPVLGVVRGGLPISETG